MSTSRAAALLTIAAPSIAALVLAACSMKEMAPESPTDADASESMRVHESEEDHADHFIEASTGDAMPMSEVLSASEPAPAMAAPARSAAVYGKKKRGSTRGSVAAAPPPPPPPSIAPMEHEPMPLTMGRADVGASGATGGMALDLPAAVPAVAQSTESFTDHGVNPFTLSTDDALSTFSIDVDTASYAVARRKLQSGSLPPEAAVRVEEFINYLDYDSYIAPKHDPFAVNMEAMPDPFRPGHHILRVGVQGKEVSREERKPVHLVFLVDVSGSMSSADKLGYARKSLHMMVDGLREDDTVGLCTYAGRVARVLEPTSAGNKREIHDAIEGLKSGGSTAMSSGIDIAYDMAMEQFKPGHENRVVILSDGDANVGRTSWDDMLSQIKSHADKGVTLSTIGFGMGNYQDTLMEQLANNGDGNNFYIDSQEQAQRVFVEELGGTMVTIARDVKIQVEFNPESVAAYRLIGYENRDIADRDFRNDRVDAGEVGSDNVTALCDVILKDGYTPELTGAHALRSAGSGQGRRREVVGLPREATEGGSRARHAGHPDGLRSRHLRRGPSRLSPCLGNRSGGARPLHRHGKPTGREGRRRAHRLDADGTAPWCGDGEPRSPLNDPRILQRTHQGPGRAVDPFGDRRPRALSVRGVVAAGPRRGCGARGSHRHRDLRPSRRGPCHWSHRRR